MLGGTLFASFWGEMGLRGTLPRFPRGTGPLPASCPHCRLAAVQTCDSHLKAQRGTEKVCVWGGSMVSFQVFA